MSRGLVVEMGQRGRIIVCVEQGIYWRDIYPEENRSLRVVFLFEDFARGITETGKPAQLFKWGSSFPAHGKFPHGRCCFEIRWNS